MIFLLSPGVATPSVATPGVATPGVATPETLRFTGIDSRDGLSHDSVYEIIQSRHGFLWIATEDGLNRYDGYTFKTFRHRPDDPTSLAENDINSLAEDGQGHVWIGTWGAGMDRFDPETEQFEHFRHDPDDPGSLLGFRVQTILADRNGKIWAGTYRYGLSRYDPDTEQFEHFRHDPERPDSLPHDHIWSLAQGPDGRVWVGTNRGLAVHEDGRFEVFLHDPQNEASLSHDRARAVRFDRSGTLWVCTERGLDSLDPATGTVTRHLSNEGAPPDQDLRTFKDLVEGPDGTLWIATRNRGLLAWDRSRPGTEGLQVHAYQSQDPYSLSNNDVRTLWVDSASNLWAGTRGGGLNRLDLKPPKFKTYASKEDGGPLSHSRVWAIQEQDRDTVWVGTSRGLDRVTLDPLVASPDAPGMDDLRAQLPDGIVRALHLDSEGQLWIGTENGLGRLDTRTGAVEQFVHDASDPNSLGHDEILDLYEDSAGNLWIGTDGGGLDRRDRWSGRFSHLRHDPQDPLSLSFDRVRVVLEDPDGTLWVGTDGGGLDRLDPARGSFRHYRHAADDPDSLSNDNVVSLLRDREQRLWVGTHSGLNLLRDDDASFRVFANLPNAFIYGILQSDDSRLWLTTNQGVLSFDPATEQAVQYGLDDGLLSLSFNEGAFHRGASGRFYTGGIRGLAVFDPAALHINTHRPPVYFTSIRNLAAPADLPGPAWTVDALTLDARSTFLSLEVAALDFTTPERNRYQYRVEGRDEDWRELEGRTLSLVDLPPGAVEVRVRGSNNDDVWSDRDAVLRLNLEAPFWHSTRSKIALAFGALLLLVGFHRLGVRGYLNRIQELERALRRRRRVLARRDRLLEEVRRENRRFTFLLSHDFKSPMVNLRGFTGELERAVDEAQGRLDGSDEELRRAMIQTIPESLGFVGKSVRHLQRMTESIQRLAQLSEHEVRWSDVPLVPTLERAVSAAKEAVPDQGAKIEIGDLPSPPTLRSDEELLEKILFELLTNALEFSSPERRPVIHIQGSAQGDMARLSVRDNGHGIDPRHRTRVFEALFRAHAAADPGRGMGLAWAQSAANRLGGWIECETGHDEGTEMIVQLPRRPDAVDPLAVEDAAEAAPADRVETS